MKWPEWVIKDSGVANTISWVQQIGKDCLG